ncbi:pyrimidine reductase [Ornatilinea apprima]|uniref:Pyrimidine reductase n=1 Tax=Ornatilinea apprima TaxID=1134406 RepID=A0A0P6Y6L8_9CHLR|nr:dihydrofolate reductase family protein [Ornatilinea apprima]KPL81071.1 pyrimidine reductase [Ornatilinea apprima]
MDELITQLYPLPSSERQLKGLYLSHNLRQYSHVSKKPFVYANFIVSLDGRIAVPHEDGNGQAVPTSIANERDWRLFQELATQSDLLISSGRYLRDWAAGRAQEILRVDDPRFSDLKGWRLDHNLPPQPDIAIISSSLEFPIPEVLTKSRRKVIVFTTNNPDLERVKEIEATAGKVFVAGDSSVSGEKMVQQMHELGYHTIYSAAGPKILHLLLKGGVLDRLYLTQTNRLLGGQPFSSIVEGDLFDAPIGVNLHTLYFDSHGLDGLGQLFMSYNLANQPIPKSEMNPQ